MGTRNGPTDVAERSIWLDERLLRKLHDEHDDLVRRRIERVIPRGNGAQDAGQHVWIAAGRSWVRYQTRDAAGVASLTLSEEARTGSRCTIIRNVLKNELRTRRRRRARRVDTPVELVAERSVADDEQDIIDLLDDEIARGMVREEAERLGGMRSILFIGRFFDNREVAELAAMHGWTERSVSASISASKRRIIRRVRQRLGLP